MLPADDGGRLRHRHVRTNYHRHRSGGRLHPIYGSANNAVLGIELLEFDADVLGAARAFAAEHTLAFPRDLAAAFAAA
jgi:hypothetical protein